MGFILINLGMFGFFSHYGDTTAALNVLVTTVEVELQLPTTHPGPSKTKATCSQCHHFHSHPCQFFSAHFLDEVWKQAETQADEKVLRRERLQPTFAPLRLLHQYFPAVCGRTIKCIHFRRSDCGISAGQTSDTSSAPDHCGTFTKGKNASWS